MRVSKYIYVVLILFQGYILPLISRDSNDIRIRDTLKIEEVTIISPRKVSETGIIISTVDSLVIKEKANRTLSEVLAEHSPVFIKTYGRGALATASFRGTAPSHTKVNWNGIEINSPMLGMTDFSLIPVFFADDIKLYHGTGAMKETSGALGGLISLDTKPDRDKKISGSFIQGIGSFGTWDNFFRINAGKDRLHSGTRIFYSHSDNDFKFINRDIIDSVDLETGTKYHPLSVNRNAGYSQYGILQEVYYRAGDKDLLKISVWGQQSDRYIPSLTANESGSDGGKGRQKDNFLRVAGSWKHYAERLQLEYLSGINIQDINYSFSNDISGLGIIHLVRSDAKSVSLINKAEAGYRIRNDGSIQARVSWISDKVDSYESISRVGYDKQWNRASLLLSWSMKWGERVQSGVFIGEEVSGRKWSPLLFHFTGEYHFLDNNRLFLHGGIARNVKFPGLNDLYYHPGGNPDLKHETALNKEFSLNSNIKYGLHNYTLRINCYFTDVRDWILWLPTFKGYWEPGNIEKVSISGLETSLEINGRAGIIAYKIRSDYAFTSSKNRSYPLSDTDLSSGKQLPFIPLHSANIMMHISRSGWSLSWLWNYFSERFINSSNDYNSSRDYLYPYFMNQFTAGKSITGLKYKADISLNIHNLFDEEYRSILQRPMPGRNFSLMVKINL